MKKHSEENNSEPNPWFLTSVVLAIVLVLSFAMNIYTISKVGTVQTTGNTAPTQQVVVPTQQAAPTGTAPTADNDPVLGSKDAKVTIIEFSDFQCPFCQKFHQDSFGQLKTEYIDTGKVKFVYRDFPLGMHPQAQKAAEASECAHEQGKYWEMYEVLFANSASLSVDNEKAWASQLGLDTTKFNSCLDSGKYATEVQADQAAGSAAGVLGTPTFFINGQKIVGAQPYSAFKTAIDQALAN